MNVKEKKLLLIAISLTSAGIPVFVLLMFYFLFPDFYKEGFLTGLGQFFVCILFFLINLIFYPIFSEQYLTKLLADHGFQNAKDKLISRLILLHLLEVCIQIMITIWVENPFKDPPAFQFSYFGG